MHRVPKPKLKKPSLDWFKKMPRRRDPNDERTLLNPTGLQAPPNSPRERNILFGTPRPSQHHRRTHSSTDSSSEDSSRTQRFFSNIVSIDDNTIDDVVYQPLQAPRSSPPLRASVRRLSNPRTPRNKQGIGPTVPLDPEPAPGTPALEGLALKQAAAVWDPEHPLDLVPIFNAWLARGPCKDQPLRLKTPQQGEPFMSRTRFSGQDSFLFDHDADHDVPEQIAARELLDRLASCQSPEWPEALNKALAALKAYLDNLKTSVCVRAVKDRQVYKRVKDTLLLRDLMHAVEKALPTNPQTINNFRPDDDPKAHGEQSSEQGSLVEDDGSRVLAAGAGPKHRVKDPDNTA